MAHPDKMPLVLQDHSNPVRPRNICIRPLPQGPQEWAPPMDKGIQLSDNAMEQYVGVYGRGRPVTIEHQNGKLMARIARLPFFELMATSENELLGIRVDSRFTIDRDAKGKIKGMTWFHSGTSVYCAKTR